MTFSGRSRVELNKQKMQLNAGAWSGLTRGSILAVYPPNNEKPDSKNILGHVQVTELMPTTATVVSCEHGKKPAVPADRFPAEASCVLAARDFGDLRVRYALAVADANHQKLMADALKGLDKEVQEMVKAVPDVDAEWLLVVKNGKLQIRQSEGRKLEPDKAAEVAQGHAISKVTKIFEICPIDQPADKIALDLGRDLARIFTPPQLVVQQGHALVQNQTTCFSEPRRGGSQ
jgi:hypothetical protein